MRIQHNIPAMNAYRNYNINTSAVNKNLEKLSSGYKINRAGDDAAGLAISEKMRAQITGLEAATKNVKDGISLVKTAEGAMQEVQDMLNRMVNLATQSANGTYDNEVDRANLQKEVDQLQSEINRIADSSNFNGIKLLDGSQAVSMTTKNMEAYEVGGALAITPIHDATPVETPAQARFHIDFSSYTFTANGAGDGTMDITLGGTSGVSLMKDENGNDIFTIDGSMTGEALAQKIADETKSVELDGNVYNLSVSNGKLYFTSEDNLKISNVAGDADFKVAVQGLNITSTDDAKTDVDPAAGQGNASNNGSGLAITVDNYGAPDEGGVLATASFELAAADIKDGTALRIGDETYVFAVGKNSSFIGQENVVDLTKYTGAEDDFSKIALGKLSAAAESNKSVKVEVALDANNTIYLTEKEGGLDRDRWDVYGPNDGTGADNDADATWKGFVKLGTATVKGTGLTLQIGDTSDSYNQLRVNIGDIHTAALGISEINISTQVGAADAVNVIKNAINQVSSIRGTLGATQNRLEHTQNNLSVMRENIQDAESTIRDTDIAEEMMSYTKNNILVQSAQAMLAQANQIPQGVLQLLG